MALHPQIKEELKDAMRAKDEIKLNVLRGLLTAFTNELVVQKRKPDEELSDDDVMKVITRSAKQRKDSIEQFEKGGRADLADTEKKELSILEAYLPQMMGVEEIEKIAKTKKEELGIADTTKKGMLMGALMKELKGKADGGDVKTVVDKLFT